MDLLLRDFSGALEATKRANKLLPDGLWIETNHAHALMFLGRSAEALSLYMGQVGEKVAGSDDKLWQQVILENLAQLRKAGLDDPLMRQVEARFAAVPK